MKRSLFSSIRNDRLPEIDNQDIIKLLVKLSIIFIIFAAFALLITIIIALIFMYSNCTRRSRVHKQIPVEYLDSSDMINYSENAPIPSTSERAYARDRRIDDS